MNARTPAAAFLERASFCYGEDDDFDEEGVPSCVQDISFEVAPGKVVVLCGRSGDGKSTVLRMIEGLAGTFFPGRLEGVITVCGRDVRSMDARTRTESVGVVLQDPRSQFFMADVADEIAFASENLGTDPQDIARRIEDAAQSTGVGALLDEQVDGLSSGEKQRVALAAAIACTPRILVLDEPTSNLDAAGIEELVAILHTLKERGVAVVVSEHRLHHLVDIADDFLCLKSGRIVARWSSEDIQKMSLVDAEAFSLRHPAMKRQASGQGLPGGWSVENLTHLYPSTGRGIRHVGAVFRRGAVSVVKGENGAGKTTLAKVLCGAAREQQGAVLCDGRRLSRRQRRRASYFVMQDADYQLYAGSVVDEIVLGRTVDEALKARATEALAAFDLTDVADRHPASLSGGQKQRVTLAAAYCSDADLVVLDEPTSGLDGRGVQGVAAWCSRLAREGKTVVIITHDSLLASLAGDAVIELKPEEKKMPETGADVGLDMKPAIEHKIGKGFTS